MISEGFRAEVLAHWYNKKTFARHDGPLGQVKIPTLNAWWQDWNPSSSYAATIEKHLKISEDKLSFRIFGDIPFSSEIALPFKTRSAECSPRSPGPIDLWWMCSCWGPTREVKTWSITMFGGWDDFIHINCTIVLRSISFDNLARLCTINMLNRNKRVTASVRWVLFYSMFNRRMICYSTLFFYDPHIGNGSQIILEWPIIFIYLQLCTSHYLKSCHRVSQITRSASRKGSTSAFVEPTARDLAWRNQTWGEMYARFCSKIYALWIQLYLLRKWDWGMRTRGLSTFLVLDSVWIHRDVMW